MEFTDSYKKQKYCANYTAETNAEDCWHDN